MCLTADKYEHQEICNYIAIDAETDWNFGLVVKQLTWMYVQLFEMKFTTISETCETWGFKIPEIINNVLSL